MQEDSWEKKRCSLSAIFNLTHVVAIMLFCPALPAWAEEAETEKSSARIGDMVVTATKMSTEVDKIPTNITVMSREELEKYPGHYNALTVLQEMNIPGVYFPANGNGGGNGDVGISTRGSEVSHWRAKIMINGVEFNGGNGYIRAGRLAIHDIERIEITKTPSAEYGDNASGGVINVITRTAREPLEASAGLAFTSLGGGNGYSVLNGSRGDWSYYLDVSAVREDSYQDEGYYDGNNIYGKVDYTLNNEAQLTFHGSYKDSEGIYATGLTREAFDKDPTQNATGADRYYETEDNLGALVYRQQLGAHELMGKMELHASNFQTYWNGSYIDRETWQAHPEVNMTFNHDIGNMVNTLVLGGEYRYHELDAKKYTATSFYDVGAINTSFTREDISYAGYLQDELRVSEAFTVTVGIRYDYFDLEQTAHTASSNAWTQAKGDFSPKVGLTYQLCDEVNLFAGFNSGITSPVRVSQWWTNGELDPEKLRSYEVGLRGNISGWLDYNIALFWQEVSDKFVRESADADAQYENAGETSSKGVELGVNAKLPHGFYSSTSFTYQDSEFDEFVSQGVDYSGNTMTGVPDIIFSVKIGYFNEMFGDISINPVYTGKRYFNYANTNTDGAFWVLNARYAQTIGRFELYVAANNLLDESAVGSGSGNPGNEMLSPIAGLNAIVGLNVKF
ncbi:TonB-dependent receptor [Desulfobulbus rhabdoformis]|uniref:TonB-dependent receptor family protein n=1 Tax=Desulfobulbus rhabdoformis TaxID=34032 RepID=UPI00196651CF|nr:TonB-dependent receptor [Desulfobulbus rhabdoformis]MBM9616736.1 TonB-dependent receptor [Desulfobulbus rhabdoformis]